jgi:hypothetical protein
VRHSVAEEEYLYPAARKPVEGGAQLEGLADPALEAHALVERLLKDLEGTEPEQLDFEQTMTRLVASFTEGSWYSSGSSPRCWSGCPHHHAGVERDADTARHPDADRAAARPPVPHDHSD